MSDKGTDVWFLTPILNELRKIVALLAEANKWLKKLVDLIKPPLPNPGPLTLTFEGESAMDMILVGVTLPPNPADITDIEGGKLTVVGDKGTDFSTDVSKTDALAEPPFTVHGIKGVQDEKAKATFVYVDDSGNQSVVPSVLDFVFTDVVPPADPGGLSLTFEGEVNEPDPVPPTPAPEPTPEP